ncbi:MAG: hypothetical protein C5B51_03690 [Terriglobia bacterium]|nr:MAG: hypothetical protein C5B51_03690 [Terriglobia bacterium]
MRNVVLYFLLGVAVPAFGQKFTAETLANPAAAGSLQPNWSAASDGSVVLSWIEPGKNGLYSLRYAVRRGGAWSEARTIAENRHFFRHPAEVPEVMALNDKSWMAHWVEMPKETSEAEFTYVSSSTDGIHWTAPAIAHKDRSEVQHGLVSMVGSGNGEASLFWLETPKGEDGPAYLMRTIVNSAGLEIREERLDNDVCACCPTAVAKTAKGLLVAYRDHTPEDIRDISVIRFENGRWSLPKNVHADNWHINACPTNAASVAAKGDQVGLAWYTAAQDPPTVQVIFSSDGGSTFGKPAVVSTGHAYGYTSLTLDDDGSAIVSWLEQGKDNAARVLARAITAAGVAGPVVQLAEGGRMSLGYPKLIHSSAGTFIAWGGSKMQTAQLKK